jgi:hypothetical protein
VRIAGNKPACLGEDKKASTRVPHGNFKAATQATGIYDGNCVTSISVEYCTRVIACLHDQ